jgi:hypothetical protein
MGKFTTPIIIMIVAILISGGILYAFLNYESPEMSRENLNNLCVRKIIEKHPGAYNVELSGWGSSDWTIEIRTDATQAYKVVTTNGTFVGTINNQAIISGEKAYSGA